MANSTIILDANILIRAVLGKKVRQLLIDNKDNVSFYTPVLCVQEAQDHLPKILHKRGIEPEQTIEFLEHVLTLVQEVEDFIYKPFQAEASNRISIRDPNDWPVVATALALKCPIWTEDNDFFGAGIATWTTDRIHLFFNR